MLSTILCTLGLTIATASASTSSLSSQIDVNGVVKSIKQYSTTGTWSSANYQVVQDTLGASISNPPNIASSPSTSATASCTISNPYNANKISQILSSCNNILVDGLTVPAGTTLKLDAEPNTVITFKGHTTWQYKGANYDLLQLSGENLIVQGSPGHVIDGNGPAWWDGLGSNGAGSKNKPDHFITVSGVSGYTVLKNLYIKNAPSHVFDVTGADELYAFGVVIDLLDGDKILSNGKEAAHNTDGWDIASTTNSLFTNNVVFNQDDCVAVTSGTNVVINNYYCSGGHGLSVGSVGGKSDKTVEQVTFSNSKVVDSQNGCRIKANSGETGKIDSVTYENISIENISIYGIDIQQDYLNGGATGKPTAGVTITNIVMNNIQGSVQANADNYYILVATPSTNASTWKFKNVDVTGGAASCNSSPPGFTCQ